MNLVFLLFILASVKAFPSNVNYCASFDAAETGGATGYVAVSLFPTNGMASYSYALNLNGMQTANCVMALGLKYHIHSYWYNATATSSAGPLTCGASVTGGHFDPNLACSSSSQQSATSCKMLGRNNTNYACTSQNFQQGQFSFCEVGDLSGKFGLALPASGTNLAYSSNGNFADPLPPYGVNYEATTMNKDGQLVSNMWSSVVFHCMTSSTTDSRLLCAKLQTDTSKCTQQGAVFPSAAPGTSFTSSSPSSATTGLASTTVAGAVVGIIAFFIIFIIVFILSLQISPTIRSYFLDSPTNNAAHDSRKSPQGSASQGTVEIGSPVENVMSL